MNQLFLCYCAGVAKPGLRRQTQDLFLQRFGGSNPFPCTFMVLKGEKPIVVYMKQDGLLVMLVEGLLMLVLRC